MLLQVRSRTTYTLTAAPQPATDSTSILHIAGTVIRTNCFTPSASAHTQNTENPNGTLTFTVDLRGAGKSGRADARIRSGRVQTLGVNAAQVGVLSAALVHVVTTLVRLPGVPFRAGTRERAVQIVTQCVRTARR